MGRLWRDLWPQPFFAMPFCSESHLCMPQRLESEDAVHFGRERIMARHYNERSDTVPWQQSLALCSKVPLLLQKIKNLPKCLWAYQDTEDRASIWQACSWIKLMRWSILLNYRENPPRAHFMVKECLQAERKQERIDKLGALLLWGLLCVGGASETGAAECTNNLITWSWDRCVKEAQ